MCIVLSSRLSPYQECSRIGNGRYRPHNITITIDQHNDGLFFVLSTANQAKRWGSFRAMSLSQMKRLASSQPEEPRAAPPPASKNQPVRRIVAIEMLDTLQVSKGLTNNKEALSQTEDRRIR
jgi:hypothetical protein